MKKTTILENVLFGYQYLSPEDYESLTNQITEFDKTLDFADADKLSDGLLKNIPKLQILHQASVRRSLEKIESNTATIKFILVIYFIASIIAAIFFVFSITSK
jgi:hypothetical protein